MKQFRLPITGEVPSSQNNRKHTWSVIFLFILLSFLVRFPYYFKSVIDWDESSFINQGASLLSGNLPYTVLWDNKPPLVFVFFALVLLLGKSIVLVRIAGTICVFLTAYMIWRIGKLVWNRDAGLVAGILTIVFISLCPDNQGQPTMTEIIALVPATGALLILLRGPANWQKVFFSGVLLSVATLVRANLAYLDVAVVLFIAARLSRRGVHTLLRCTCAYIIGGILPFLIVFMPYVLTGNEEQFMGAVFLAPLSFVRESSDSGMLSILTAGFDRSNALLWLGCLLGVPVVFARWKAFHKDQRCQIILITVFLLSVFWSVIATRRDYGHYLIQVIPYMALFAGYLFSAVRAYLPKVPLLIILCAGLTAPARPLLSQYAWVGSRLLSHQALLDDESRRIASYISANNPNNEPIYMMTDPIVYWLLGVSPISRAVSHPSTIGKEYFLKIFLGPQASTEGELAAILDKKPLFIVKREKVWYLSGNAAKFLDNSIAEHYTLVETVGDELIFRRVQK